MSYQPHIDTAIEQQFQMQRDAARYKWLRENLYQFIQKFPHGLTPEQMDTIVDKQKAAKL